MKRQNLTTISCHVKYNKQDYDKVTLNYPRKILTAKTIWKDHFKIVKRNKFMILLHLNYCFVCFS